MSFCTTSPLISLAAFTTSLFLLALGDVTDVRDPSVPADAVAKRLLLNSDDDVRTEIQLLHEKLDGQQSQIHNLTAQNTELKAEVRALKDDQPKGAGTTYTRWGKETCPGNGSELVYSGYMAGTHYSINNSGNPANYLCLTEEPIWDYYSEDINNHIEITSIEYSFYPHHDTDLDQFFGSNIHLQNAACSVCHSARSATVMIPGRNLCYPGWTLEYQGYLVSGYPGYADSTEYVCLDRRPDALPGSDNYLSENYLYFVEGACSNGLECPPYVQGRELSCVVCSM